MSDSPNRLTNAVTNIVLLALGAVAIFLVYAFAMRVADPRPATLRVENPGELTGEIIQVEVRNGCGVSGLAAQYTQFLREYGFDVVEVGDHTNFDEAYTLVIDRVGNEDAARQVAMALGVSEDRIVQRIDPDLYLDTSVIIGRDYETLRPHLVSFEAQ